MRNKQLSPIEHSQNIPQLRFPEFEEKWSLRKFNKIYSFYTTNSLSRDKLNYEDGTVKNIHYGDIHTKFATLFDIEKEKVPFINSDVDLSKIKDENFCQEGDLLIADASEDYNDIGKTTEIINLDNQRLISGLHTFHARPNKYKMALGFPGYLLQSWKVRKQVMTIAQGTKVLSLATSRLGNIDLVITSLPEQQKIASFLTDVDTKITQLTKKKALLAQYKKGVMQKIFKQELRFKPDLSEAERDESNAFPEWEVKKLGEVANITTGSSNRQDSGLDGKYTFFDRSEDIRTSSRYLFEGEAVIVAGEGSDFVPKYYVGKFDLHQRTYAIMEFKESISKFIYFYIHFHRRYFLSQAVGSTVKSLRLPMFQKMPINLPIKEEQTKIANFLSDIDIKIEALNTKIENSKAFKKGLLQQMFV